LGYALAGVTQPTILSTKLGGSPQPFDPRDKAALRRSVEESLRLLGRDYVDFLLIHEPDRPGRHDWFSDALRYVYPRVGAALCSLQPRHLHCAHGHALGG